MAPASTRGPFGLTMPAPQPSCGRRTPSIPRILELANTVELLEKNREAQEGDIESHACWAASGKSRSPRRSAACGWAVAAPDDATALDACHPRLLLLQGIDRSHRPGMFGGGVDKAEAWVPVRGRLLRGAIRGPAVARLAALTPARGSAERGPDPAIRPVPLVPLVSSFFVDRKSSDRRSRLWTGSHRTAEAARGDDGPERPGTPATVQSPACRPEIGVAAKVPVGGADRRVVQSPACRPEIGSRSSSASGPSS